MRKNPLSRKHLIYTIESFLRTLILTLILFVVLLLIFSISSTVHMYNHGEKVKNAFNAGITSDLTHLKNQGDEVARDPLVQKYLLEQNSTKLIEILQKERNERSIGLMGVANKDGVIIGRTRSSKRSGDNVFLLNPVGRIVSEGKYAQSIEIPVGFDPQQIFLTTGRPIIKDNEMIGALFANYLTDDNYATRFRNKYLSDGIEVVFYNKNTGIYGNSFTENDTRKLVNSYFNSGSEWIADGISDKIVSIKSTGIYFVKNIVFPGIDKSPGGALIFIPQKNIPLVADSGIIFTALLFFILYSISQHRKKKRETRGWRYVLLLTGFSFVILGITLSIIYLQHTGYRKLKKVPYPLYNSTIRLQPDFGIYDIGFEQVFSVFVDTGDENINTVQLGLIFDPSEVKVKSLDTASSTCSYVIENKISNDLGKADLSCVILHNNENRKSLLIADIVTEPIKPGSFSFSFDQEKTKVLADDGLGTNVLRTAQASSYRVDNFDKSLTMGTSSVSTKHNERSFIIFSPTHPNQSKWYNSKEAKFLWIGQPNSIYAYAFDNSPDTLPTKEHMTTEKHMEFTMPNSGIYYFHLQLASGGPIAHYRLQSDQSPPIIESINFSSEQIKAGDVVRILFKAHDTESGVQQNYYVDLGNHLFLPSGSQLYIPFIESGDHKIKLRVYDSAGNYSEESTTVHVE